ncbi:MAG: DUF4150 domain-containing protein [Candidatus Cloacimonetes bacterium]|nr:DUF4150 domain-containing protein [Candidatus Cloacimonadota bacterium]
MVTVAGNKLSLCHKGCGGVAIASIPDVCKTPGPMGMIVSPFPNIAQTADLQGGSTKVKADGNSIAIQGSKLSRSTGDEAGVGGGIISGVNMGEAAFTTFSPTVLVEGKPASRFMDKLTMNKQNTACMSGIIIPPVAAGGGGGGAGDTEEIKEEELKGITIQDKQGRKVTSAKKLLIVPETKKEIESEIELTGLVDNYNEMKNPFNELKKLVIGTFDDAEKAGRAYKRKKAFRKHDKEEPPDSAVVKLVLNWKFGGSDILSVDLEKEIGGEGEKVDNYIGSDISGMYEEEKTDKKEYEVISDFKFSVANCKTEPVPKELVIKRGVAKDTIEVLQYPDDEFGVKVVIENILDFERKINKNIKDSISNRIGFVDPILAIKLANLKWENKWGWKEDKASWDAYHNFISELGSDPLVGIDLGLRINLMRLILFLALGIPPIVGKLIGEYLADLIINIFLTIRVKVFFRFDNRNYVYHESKFDLSGVLGVEGGIKVQAVLSLGSEYYASLKITLEAHPTIEGEANFRYDKPYLKSLYSVLANKCEATFTVGTSIGKKSPFSFLSELVKYKHEDIWVWWDKKEIVKDKKLFDIEVG